MGPYQGELLQEVAYILRTQHATNPAAARTRQAAMDALRLFGPGGADAYRQARAQAVGPGGAPGGGPGGGPGGMPGSIVVGTPSQARDPGGCGGGCVPRAAAVWRAPLTPHWHAQCVLLAAPAAPEACSHTRTTPTHHTHAPTHHARSVHCRRARVAAGRDQAPVRAGGGVDRDPKRAHTQQAAGGARRAGVHVGLPPGRTARRLPRGLTPQHTPPPPPNTHRPPLRARLALLERPRLPRRTSLPRCAASCSRTWPRCAGCWTATWARSPG
jgi:hypothetical protein